MPSAATVRLNDARVLSTFMDERPRKPPTAHKSWGADSLQPKARCVRTPQRRALSRQLRDLDAKLAQLRYAERERRR